MNKEKEEELKEETLPKGYFGPIRVQMGHEPPAVLNFGGGPLPKDLTTIPLVKKGWRAKKKTSRH